MNKMSDMAMTIEELRSAAAAINEAANWLAEQFSGTADEAPAKEPATKEEQKPELKLENVRAVLAKSPVPGIPLLSVHYFRSMVPPSYLLLIRSTEALLKDAEVLDDAT